LRHRALHEAAQARGRAPHPPPDARALRGAAPRARGGAHRTRQPRGGARPRPRPLGSAEPLLGALRRSAAHAGRSPPVAPGREALVPPGHAGAEAGGPRMGAGPILALVIEFYLPPSASETEVAQTAEQAYRPLLHLLEDHRERAALTFAVDPALARRLVAARQSGILHGLASLVEGGSAEFAAGTRSHALLPRIPRAEVVRQIQLGDELMRELFGDAW